MALASVVVCVSPTADFSSEVVLNGRATIEKALAKAGATIVKSITKKGCHFCSSVDQE